MKHIFIIVIFSAVISGCKEDYFPELEPSEQSLLVVEGNLNAGADSTFIRLTRSQSLNDLSAIKVENNAQVRVEGKDNTVRTLTPLGNGQYVSPNLNLIIGNEYRLRVRTSNGREYLSEFVTARTTPPIDSVGWHRDEKGVQLYVNTHDPANATRYYRWEYAETWEIHSYFPSYIIYDNSIGAIRPRIYPQEYVSLCWKNSASTNILINNTLRLQQDIIHEQPLVFIASGDEKLFHRYSLLVKQYALEEKAYEFYDLLRKNTENIGSFFSPQPTEVKGNLLCLTDPKETVIGYITASTVSSKRIFISVAEVPQWPDRTVCEEYRVPNHPDSIKYFVGVGFMPAYYLGNPPDQYLFSSPQCIDCTTRGGTTTKPSFW